jgi:hypothetical protein
MKNKETTREDYEDIVRRPGKFEGEQAYVPYFWELGCSGFADEDVDGVWVFNVSTEDKENFPELKKRKRVKLYEREDGFVIEV